jgi:KUP system potassium uptake protein
MLGIIGAALFFGDALITPAVSVLAAIEGLKVVAPGFDLYIVPLTVAILVVLFAAHSRGTASVANFFGPVMTVWFLVISVQGVIWIATAQRAHGVQSLVRISLVQPRVTGW